MFFATYFNFCRRLILLSLVYPNMYVDGDYSGDCEDDEDEDEDEDEDGNRNG